MVHLVPVWLLQVVELELLELEPLLLQMLPLPLQLQLLSHLLVLEPWWAQQAQQAHNHRRHQCQ